MPRPPTTTLFLRERYCKRQEELILEIRTAQIFVVRRADPGPTAQDQEDARLNIESTAEIQVIFTTVDTVRNMPTRIDGVQSSAETEGDLLKRPIIRISSKVD
jgi:hypothetical protein